MKIFIRSAAVVALTGVAAFAQSDLKANVPFSFTTPGGGHMAAGKYSMNKVPGPAPTTTYRVYNADTKQGVLAIAPNSVNRPVNEPSAAPMIAFKCAGDVCALSGIFPAGSKTGYGVPYELKPIAPATEIAEIRIPLGE